MLGSSLVLISLYFVLVTKNHFYQSISLPPPLYLIVTMKNFQNKYLSVIKYDFYIIMLLNEIAKISKTISQIILLFLSLMLWITQDWKRFFPRETIKWHSIFLQAVVIYERLKCCFVSIRFWVIVIPSPISQNLNIESNDRI